MSDLNWRKLDQRTDRPTDRPTNGRTKPYIHMRGRIQKLKIEGLIYFEKIIAEVLTETDSGGTLSLSFKTKRVSLSLVRDKIKHRNKFKETFFT